MRMFILVTQDKNSLVGGDDLSVTSGNAGHLHLSLVISCDLWSKFPNTQWHSWISSVFSCTSNSDAAHAVCFITVPLSSQNTQPGSCHPLCQMTTCPGRGCAERGLQTALLDCLSGNIGSAILLSVPAHMALYPPSSFFFFWDVHSKKKKKKKGETERVRCRRQTDDARVTERQAEKIKGWFERQERRRQAEQRGGKKKKRVIEEDKEKKG